MRGVIHSANRPQARASRGRRAVAASLALLGIVPAVSGCMDYSRPSGEGYKIAGPPPPPSSPPLLRQGDQLGAEFSTMCNAVFVSDGSIIIDRPLVDEDFSPLDVKIYGDELNIQPSQYANEDLEWRTRPTGDHAGGKPIHDISKYCIATDYMVALAVDPADPKHKKPASERLAVVPTGAEELTTSYTIPVTPNAVPDKPTVHNIYGIEALPQITE